WPSIGRRNPEMIENSVVLPAPFGPISAVMRPALAVNDAPSTARRPPKRTDTLSTRSNASAMAALRRDAPPHQGADRGQQSGDATRRKGNDSDEHATIDHQVEPGGAAGHELGQFSQCFDHERAEQRTEHRADAADDRREQGFDRDPR